MFWKLEEARLVQERSSGSAADADTMTLLPVVPAGKVYVILGMGYIPSVAETQVISFYKVTPAGSPLCLLNPVSLALNPARATFLEQGMELFLLPGEYILVRRGTHTAGSSMSATMQFIEIDLPLYTYDEPQVVKRQARAISTLRSRLGGGTGGPGISPGSSPGTVPRGRGGGPEPV